MNGTEFAQTWCRMWSGEPELAHELIAPGGRQWSGQTAALDHVVGPDAAADFCRDHHQRTHHHYAPRTLVLAGDRVAYSWDVTFADGTVSTGIDVNVLRDGLVVENWTLVGPHDPAVDVLGSGVASLAGIAVHREPVVDAARGTAAYLVDGGVELVVVRDGALVRRTSIASERSFAF